MNFQDVKFFLPIIFTKKFDKFFVFSIVPPDETDREMQSQHKPIARKRMSGPYEDYSINEDQSLGLSPRRKRLHLEENKAGMGKGRLAGRLGSVSRVSF